MWVGLRYRSKDGELQSLYIVAGEETTAKPVGRSLVPVYFEHDDQSQSCYEGADRISITASSVTLTLNKNGRHSLELPRTVEFATAKPGRDYRKAKTMFAEMRKRHGGDVIHVAEPGGCTRTPRSRPGSNRGSLARRR